MSVWPGIQLEDTFRAHVLGPGGLRRWKIGVVADFKCVPMLSSLKLSWSAGLKETARPVRIAPPRMQQQ